MNATLRLAAVAAASLALAPVRRPGGPTGTLVVANMNDNTAMVIDAATGRALATLPTGEAPHEVAVSHDGRWAMVSNYGVRGRPGGTLTLIDIAAASVARTIALPDGFQRPHGMAFLPGDTVLAVTSEVRQVIGLLDVRTAAMIRTIPTHGRTSHMLALTARGDRLYVSNIADGAISAIDMRGLDSTRLIRVARQPEGIAVAPDGSSVWTGSDTDSVVVVIDAGRAAPSDTLRGFGLAYRLAIAPDGTLAVITDPVRAEVRVFTVADRSLKFTIAVPRDSLVATAEIPGSPSPEGVAISSDSKWAFVTLQGRNRVATIDLGRGVITAIAPIGTWSDGIGYSALQHGAQ